MMRITSVPPVSAYPCFMQGMCHTGEMNPLFPNVVWLASRPASLTEMPFGENLQVHHLWQSAPFLPQQANSTYMWVHP